MDSEELYKLGGPSDKEIEILEPFIDDVSKKFVREWYKKPDILRSVFIEEKIISTDK